MMLDGNVVSQDSARYVSNCLCVFRVRPRHLDEDERSDEDIDDEELILTKHDLKEALKTRVGGHHKQEGTQTVKYGSKTTHEANSKQATGIAQRTWHSVEDSTRPESISPFIGDEQVKDAFKGARQSQLSAESHSSSST